MPSFGGGQDTSGMLKTAVSQVAPLATQWHGPTTGAPIQQVFNQPATPKSPGALSAFGHWLGGAASQIGSIGESVGKWIGKTTVNMAEAPFKFGFDITTGAIRTSSEANRANQLDQQQQNLINSRSVLTDKAFKDGMNSIVSERNKLNGDLAVTQARLTNSKQEGINTAAALVTIVSGGIGKAIEGATDVGTIMAGQYLKSAGTDAVFQAVEDSITKIAEDPGAFEALSPAAQRAFQTATAEAVTSGATSSAATLARTAAVNLAFKYPLYYSYLSSTGNQIYNELDQAKYGAAVRTIAFNAALIVSGGPIGWALEHGGKGIGNMALKVFGQSSFLDTLSQGIHTGAGDGLANAIHNLTDSTGYKFFEKGRLITGVDSAEVQQRVAQNMSNLEATNLRAVGKDPVAAAIRVLKGMENYEGISMSNFTHEEALMNMNNFAAAQQYATYIGQQAGINGLTVGRLDARALKTISDAVAPAIEGGKETALKVWDTLKETNTDQSWANNENFDRQIKALINKHDTQAELEQSIKRIKASTEVAGIPSELTKPLSDMGYIPITPAKVEAPFTKGTGVLTTHFGDTNNFFNQAVEPLPILSYLGDAITKTGLSPYASSQRVYQTFTDNVAANLKGLNVTQKVLEDLNKTTTEVTTPAEKEGVGALSAADVKQMKKDGFSDKQIAEYGAKGTIQGGVDVPATATEAATSAIPVAKTEEDAVDSIIKRLSSYAKDPTKKGISAKMPIQDLRQMTNAEVRAAIPGISYTEARSIQRALAQAFIQVPLAIRGMGEKAVDYLYKAGPISTIERRYLRIQGAARFAWNPFFQYLRVIPKTEILSEFEGGGFVSSVFRGQLGQLSNIQTMLKDGGFLSKDGHFGNVIAGEAVDYAGISESANLGKTLLPGQEKSIAGLVAAQAQRMGVDVPTYLSEFPQQVRDTIQSIAEYDKRSNLLNSPLMRTLNVAFFPLRFETKVATIMVKSLAKTSLMTQVSVLNGMMQAHQWLNSPEGMAWYARNSTAIGLFEYITPTAELNQVFESLVPGHDHSLGNFGELGGLPFGWIPLTLDAVGLTHFSQPGVDAATGQIYTSYVPATMKGQIATAIQDFLGSIFSYPGAEMGLPSKTSITRSAGLGLVGGNKKVDLKLNTPSVDTLSSQQQNYIQAIKSANPGNPAINPPPTNQQTLPTQNPTTPGEQVTPGTSPALTTPGKASAAKKLKKGQRIPQLLPGQTTLGQL